MKVAPELENKTSLNGADSLIDRLQDVLNTTKLPTKAWLIAQIEAALAEIPFKEASLRPPPAPFRDCRPNHLLTPQEASKLLNIPVRWLYRHTQRLPHRKIGRYTRFPERELLRWAERQHA